MNRYELVELRRGAGGVNRRWTIWENDGTEDGRLVAAELTREDAGKILALLQPEEACPTCGAIGPLPCRTKSGKKTDHLARRVGNAIVINSQPVDPLEGP